LRCDGGGYGVEIFGIHVGNIETGRTLTYTLKQTMGATVEIVHGNHVIAGLE
jgi:hypothetical protein